MLKNRAIRILIALNLLAILGLGFRWWQERGAGQRQADLELGRLAKHSESMGGLRGKDFNRLIEIGRRARVSGKLSDADLEEILRAPEHGISKEENSRDHVMMWTLGMLLEPKSYTPEQRNRISAFLAPQLARNPETAMGSQVTLLAAKVAARAGSPEGPETLRRLSHSSDPTTAQLAGRLLERIGRGEQP
jgi:hypothetical protein